MPKLIIIKDYCTHAAGSDCQRCVQACPHGAITLEVGSAPTVDFDACTGCGICYGVCDAFSSARLTMADLHARIKRIALEGRRTYLTCRENVFPGLNVDTNVIVTPCLSMLSPDFWSLLLAEKIRISVACDFKYCDNCQRGGQLGAMLFPRAIQIAQERTGEEVQFSTDIPENKKLLEKYSQDNDVMGRRQAFTGFAVDVGEIASGKRRLRNSEVLRDYYEKQERMRATTRLNLTDDSVFNNLMPHGKTKRVLFPRQKMLLETVEAMPEIAERISIALSLTDTDVCQHTYACAKACPTGARCPNQKTGEIELDARLCIGCGICVDVCPKGACSLEETTAAVYVSDKAAADDVKGASSAPSKNDSASTEKDRSAVAEKGKEST